MKKSEEDKVMNVLLVEDNPRDVECLLFMFERLGISHSAHIVDNGEEALDFLYKRAQYKNAVSPGIILLDLNLPKMGGIEVLESVKKDSVLRHIPVIVLTSSQNESDVLVTYHCYANSYLLKPYDLKDYEKLVGLIRDYWFQRVVLPPKSEKQGA